MRSRVIEVQERVPAPGRKTLRSQSVVVEKMEEFVPSQQLVDGR
jgi:hypothetical protein